MRTTLIQLAWLWLRHKLLVALWKYVIAGVIIEGAVMKAN